MSASDPKRISQAKHALGSRLSTTLAGDFLRVHVLLELSCKAEKAPDQVLVLSPQFGIVHRFCFLAKQFSQFSALNAGFHG